MIQVLKASAGSGKTYRLAKEYVDLLLKAERERPYRNILAVTFTNKATAEMKDRILGRLQDESKSDPAARKLLLQILHDYSAFSVSTIDAFFQKTLRAFAREVGQFSGYEVELDRSSLIDEAMDRLLDSLTGERSELLSWLTDNAMEQIGRGEKVDVSGSLYKIGKLFKDSGIEDVSQYSKESLGAVRKECRKVIAEFNAKVKSFAAEAAPMVTDKRVLSSLNTYLRDFKARERVKAPTGKTLLKAVYGSRFWNLFFTGDSFSDEYKRYNTSWIVQDLIYGLGVIREFCGHYDAILGEKGVLSLDDSNRFLKRIIDGSDAPFVYEKTGVKYFNYLLDEFQDTSTIQWENMSPLLEQSNAWGHKSLIVGDVKQSIYRWRGGDWKLLGRGLKRQFGPEIVEEQMTENWRSAETILSFCDTFFTRVCDWLELDTSVFNGFHLVKKASEMQPGFVRVQFCAKEDELEKVLDSIIEARSNGAAFSDITVLVRRNAQGASVADYLVKHDIPVVSNDSLSVKSSEIVRRLADRLSDPQRCGSFHSLLDLCERMLRELRDEDSQTFDDETLFIQTFMDDVLNWTGVNGNNLGYFLKHFQQENAYISSPDRSDAVNIITVHKAKGLEAPYVIFPFAESVGMNDYGGMHDTICWCDYQGVEYPVKMSKDMSDTFFEVYSEKETEAQMTDNFNVLYVALTRAKKSLHIICKELSKTAKERVEKGVGRNCQDFSELLYAFGGKSSDYSFGIPYDFLKEKKEDSGKSASEAFPAVYTSIPLGDRLHPSADAVDFFGEDGAAGAGTSSRLRGIVLHSILENVRKPEDLSAAVDDAVLAGAIPAQDRQDCITFFEERIAAHPQWFRDARLVKNEVSIINEDGDFLRPDRVVTSDGGGICVIDYKFGEEKGKYLSQVRGYVNLYRKMGFDDVTGYIWYVPEDKVVKI